MRSQPLKDRTIAITRPAGQAGKLSALITAAGGTPIAFPLIAITPLDDYRGFEQQLEALPFCDWAIFISSNAVQHGMPRLLNRFGHIPKQLKFAAIGPVTAAELKTFGVDQVLTPQGRFDSESLLALPAMQAVAGKKIMIFRGIGGREVLTTSLESRGATVDFAECYQRINPQTDAGVLATLWQNKQLDALVITSSEAMRHLLALAERSQQTARNAGWLTESMLCVNHARIAEEITKSGWLNADSPAHKLKLTIADAPGDDAMLQCLTKALAQNDD